MKINYKIFKNLNNPFDVQEVEGRQVEIHMMNDTPYFANYVNRGQYALWTSDGKNYKLLIEEGYYDEFKEIFTPEMNLAWIEYFEKLVKTRKRVSGSFWYPALIIIAVVFLGVLLVPQFDFVPQTIIDFIQANSTYVLFGSLILLILMSVLNSSVFKRKAERVQNEHIVRINDILGVERSHELALQQDTYHKRYMARIEDEIIADEEIEETVLAEDVEEELIAPIIVEQLEEEEEVSEEEVIEEIVEEEPDFVPLFQEESEEPLIKEELDFVPLYKEVVEEPPVEEEKEVLEELSLLKVEQLREFVKNRKLPNYSTMNKTQLLESLPSMLEELRVPELKVIAKIKNVNNYSVMTKPELVYAIRNYVEEEKEEPVVVEPVVEEKPVPVVVEEKPAPVVVEPVVEEEKEEVELLDELFVLKVDQLREFVKERNITNYSVMNKTQLIEALPASLEQLRVNELKAIAKAKDLTNYSQLNKTQLVDLIVNGPQEEEEKEEPVVVKPAPVVVEEKPAPVVVEPVVEEEKEEVELLDELFVLKVDQLREFVKERNITNYSVMNKTQLIEALPASLEQLRVNELKAIAKAKDLTNYSQLNKTQLVDLIVNGPQEEEEKEEPVVVKPAPVVVEEKPAPVVVEPVVEEEKEEVELLDELFVLKVDQLREFVKERNITNYSVMNKTQLIEALPASLEQLRVNELKAIAKAKDLTNYSAMTKPQLIELIKQQLGK